MSLTRSVARNTMAQIVGKIVSTLLGVFAIALMTRYLGPTAFGGYTTVMAFLQLFGILVDLGLTLTTIQLLATEKDDRTVIGNMLGLRVTSAAIFLLSAPIAALFFPFSVEIKQGIAFTAVFFFFISVSQVLLGVFQKNMRMGRAAWAEIGGRIFLLGGVFAAMKFNLGLFGVLGATIAGSAGQVILLTLFAQSLVPLSIKFNWRFWRKALRISAPMAISIALNLVYLRADTVILSIFDKQAVVGIYGAAYRVIDVISTFPFLFAGLIMPILSASWAEGDKARFNRIMQRAFDGLSILAAPLLVGGLIVARPLMVAVAGREFSASGDVLQILLVAAVMVFWGTLGGHAIVSLRRQRIMIWSYLAAAILGLVGYFIFIPRFSLWGAAWVTVLSEFFIAAATWFVVIKTARFFPALGVTARAFLASGVMAVALIMARDLNVFLSILIGTVIYGTALFAFRGISREMLREIINLKRE